MKGLTSYLVLFLVIILGGCHRVQDREAGIALSFDDRFIAEWYTLRPLFLEYDARVTFYINGDTLGAEELTMLKQLRDDGHEIGFHGTIHGNAALLIENHGAEGYWNTEIRPGLEFFRRNGFHPTSYAFPGGRSTATADSVLRANGFITLRDVAKAERYFKGIRLYHIPPSWMPHIYWDFRPRTTFHALQIDRETELSVSELQKALRKAKDKGKVLLLFGHQPLPPNPAPDQYGFNIELLSAILKEAQALGLRYYTMSELK